MTWMLYVTKKEWANIREDKAGLWKATPLSQRWAMLVWIVREFKYILWVFCRLEGGVYKRLDEHRALCEFMEDHCSEALTKATWVKDALARQDRFLNHLQRVMPVGHLATDDVQFLPNGCTPQDICFPRLKRHQPPQCSTFKELPTE